MKNHIIRLFIIGSLIIPTFIFAQTGANVKDGITGFSKIIDTLSTTVVKSLATLFLSLALLAFFYGIVEYIWAKRQGDGGGVKKGGDFMTWGLVALFVMFSVYGIIQFGQNTLFGTGVDVTTIKIPNIQFNTNGSTIKNDPLSPPSPDTAGASANTPNTAGNGGNNIPLKNVGDACERDSECISDNCRDDSNGISKCYAPGVTGTTAAPKNYPVGHGCQSTPECASGLFCDGKTETCELPPMP